jgi:O-antigen/teichoic acid export membrane protein
MIGVRLDASVIRGLFSSQLRINMVSGVAVTLANSVVLAVAYPLYLYFLGYEQYGVWLVLSTVISFAQLGNLGINQAVMKLVAEEYGRGDVEGMQQYISSAVALLVLSGVLVLTFILLLQQPILTLFRLAPENARVVSWLMPYAACLSIYIFIVQVVNASLAGVGRMDLANYLQTAGRLVAVVVTGVLMYLGSGVASLLVGNVVCYVFIHVASLICFRRLVPVRILPLRSFTLRRTKRLLSFGASLCGGTLINIIFQSANRVILSRWAGVAVIPVYDIGFSAGTQIRAVTEAGLRALLPEISRISAHRTPQAAQRIAGINRRALGLVLMVGIPLHGILFIFAGPLLSLWLGGSFVESLPAFFRVMLMVSIASLLAVPAYYTLLGLGHAFRCFLGGALPSLVHFALLGVMVLLGRTLTLQCLAYTTLAGVVLGSLYLIVRLRFCSYGVGEAPHSVRIHASAGPAVAEVCDANPADGGQYLMPPGRISLGQEPARCLRWPAER